MDESISPLNLLLIVNSLIAVFLIVNQNESKRDAAVRQTEASISNPLENLTWISLSFQFILLLISLKVTDY